MNVQLKTNSLNVFPVPYYPIGAVYMSYVNTSPATMFGGTWEPITDRFLYGSDTSGDIGGEAMHTLTVAEMPAHTHQTRGRNGSGSSVTDGVGDSYLFKTTTQGAYGSTGGGKEHNNIPPYYAVYMWRRIQDNLEVATLDTAILDGVILG